MAKLIILGNTPTCPFFCSLHPTRHKPRTGVTAPVIMKPGSWVILRWDEHKSSQVFQSSQVFAWLRVSILVTQARRSSLLKTWMTAGLPDLPQCDVRTLTYTLQRVGEEGDSVVPRERSHRVGRSGNLADLLCQQSSQRHSSLVKWAQKHGRRGCSDEGERQGQALTSQCVVTTPSRSPAHRQFSFKHTQARHVFRSVYNSSSDGASVI